VSRRTSGSSAEPALRGGAAPAAALDFRTATATVDFDSRAALAGVDFHCGPGERVALVGPSGAGKTTLLRLLNGAQRPSAGVVTADGLDLARLTPAGLRALRSRIGFVHQDLALVPNLRVAQNVISGALGRLSTWGTLRALLHPRRDDLERAAALLERVGIGEKLFQRTDTLSGGQRQRVAIARALFQEPGALLCDEPVSSVDPARARDTVELLNALAVERGLTLVVSLHDVALAQSCFPRLVGLRRGQVVFDKPAAAVASAELESLYRLERAEMTDDAS